eukprot:8852761-Lingulodinium_polyedra.AAC.1
MVGRHCSPNREYTSAVEVAVLRRLRSPLTAADEPHWQPRCDNATSGDGADSDGHRHPQQKTSHEIARYKWASGS